jgi:hypothetical protein
MVEPASRYAPPFCGETLEAQRKAEKRSISQGEEEHARFDAELAAVGPDDTKIQPLPDPLFDERMTASWERIFDLDWVDEWMGIGAREQRRIQATFWALHRHQIRKRRPFLGR